MSKLNPEVPVKIGGTPYALRWDKRAIYDLNDYPETKSEPDDSDGAAVLKRMLAFIFCMLVDRGELKTPRDIAVAISDDEVAKLGDAFSRAIELGSDKGEDEDADPL